MRKGFYKVLLALFVLLQIVFIINIYLMPNSVVDKVSINEIVQYTQQYWNEEELNIKSLPNLNYTIIDNNETILYQSIDATSKTISEANLNQDIIMDVVVDNEKVGKILFFNETSKYIEQIKFEFLSFYFAGMITLIFMLIVYYWYIQKMVFHPFNQLKSFAVRVANGNLDIPLPMDRYHVFGAFSESFDLMREELKRAKEEEAKAKQDKKELVAKLSHDIKTPVASIKAISELMHIQTTSSKVQNQLEIINKKADQIDNLISNLFHATLEELQQLPVDSLEINSDEISKMLESSDYLGKANKLEIPECLIIADPLRLQQVIDNIINNSYKYADTSIIITSYIEDRYLVVDVKDFGQEAQFLEIDMLCEKFYRGNNAQGKSGAGLGLYISKYLMEQMNGNLSCESSNDGFCVHLFIKLAV